MLRSFASLAGFNTYHLHFWSCEITSSCFNIEGHTHQMAWRYRTGIYLHITQASIDALLASSDLSSFFSPMISAFDVYPDVNSMIQFPMSRMFV